MRMCPSPVYPGGPRKFSEIESLRDQVKTIFPNTTHLHGELGKKELAYGVERIF